MSEGKISLNVYNATYRSYDDLHFKKQNKGSLIEMKKYILTIFMIVGFSWPAIASDSKKNTPLTLRSGLQVFVGPIMSFADLTEIGYRLPGEHIDLFIQGSAMKRALSVGGRYFFNPSDRVAFFLSAKAGVYTFTSGFTNFTPDGRRVSPTAFPVNPELLVGVGLDWDLTSNFGLTTSLSSGFPTYVYPELGLKYRF